MSTVSGEIRIAAPPGVVRRILLEPRQLADWNPAFLSIRGPYEALVGQHYPIMARGGFTGNWEYVNIADERVEGRWEVPGLRETNVWEFRQHGSGTRVTHSFTHGGGLALLLRPAFSNVAELRLQRLAERAQARVLAGAA
jgi:hypothetical protein